MAQNDDQNIISELDGHTTILVPSNGYTFSRTTTQVRLEAPMQGQCQAQGKKEMRRKLALLHAEGMARKPSVMRL